MQTATNTNDIYSANIQPRHMSMKDALAHGITLEESKRRLEELIHNHYHPKQ